MRSHRPGEHKSEALRVRRTTQVESKLKTELENLSASLRGRLIYPLFQGRGKLRGKSVAVFRGSFPTVTVGERTFLSLDDLVVLGLESLVMGAVLLCGKSVGDFRRNFPTVSVRMTLVLDGGNSVGDFRGNFPTVFVGMTLRRWEDHNICNTVVVFKQINVCRPVNTLKSMRKSLKSLMSPLMWRGTSWCSVDEGLQHCSGLQAD